MEDTLDKVLPHCGHGPVNIMKLIPNDRALRDHLARFLSFRLLNISSFIDDSNNGRRNGLVICPHLWRNLNLSGLQLCQYPLRCLNTKTDDPSQVDLDLQYKSAHPIIDLY